MLHQNACNRYLKIVNVACLYTEKGMSGAEHRVTADAHDEMRARENYGLARTGRFPQNAITESLRHLDRTTYMMLCASDFRKGNTWKL